MDSRRSSRVLSRADIKQLKKANLTVPIPQNEAERLRVLRSTKLLNSETSDTTFDRFSSLAQRLFNAYGAYITLVDIDKVHVLSSAGQMVKKSGESRETSICAYTILPESADVFVVEDIEKDSRFDYIVPVNGVKIRFYAGAAVVLDGMKIGSLSIVDTQPRLNTQFSTQDRMNLLDLGAAVSVVVTARRDALVNSTEQCAKMMVEVMKDIKKPLRTIATVSDQVKSILATDPALAVASKAGSLGLSDNPRVNNEGGNNDTIHGKNHNISDTLEAAAGHLSAILDSGLNLGKFMAEKSTEEWTQKWPSFCICDILDTINSARRSLDSAQDPGVTISWVVDEMSFQCCTRQICTPRVLLFMLINAVERLTSVWTTVNIRVSYRGAEDIVYDNIIHVMEHLPSKEVAGGWRHGMLTVDFAVADKRSDDDLNLRAKESLKDDNDEDHHHVTATATAAAAAAAAHPHAHTHGPPAISEITAAIAAATTRVASFDMNRNSRNTKSKKGRKSRKRADSLDKDTDDDDDDDATDDERRTFQGVSFAMLEQVLEYVDGKFMMRLPADEAAEGADTPQSQTTPTSFASLQASSRMSLSQNGWSTGSGSLTPAMRCQLPCALQLLTQSSVGSRAESRAETPERSQRPISDAILSLEHDHENGSDHKQGKTSVGTDNKNSHQDQDHGHDGHDRHEGHKDTPSGFLPEISKGNAFDTASSATQGHLHPHPPQHQHPPSHSNSNSRHFSASAAITTSSHNPNTRNASVPTVTEGTTPPPKPASKLNRSNRLTSEHMAKSISAPEYLNERSPSGLNRKDYSTLKAQDALNSAALMSSVVEADLKQSPEDTKARHSLFGQIISVARRSLTPATMLRVLLCKDSIPAKNLMTKWLQKEGCLVVSTDNGKDGLQYMQTQQFDVCLMDFLMPVMNGIDAIGAFHRWLLEVAYDSGSASDMRNLNKEMLIIGMSAGTLRDDMAGAFMKGMHFFLPKPVTRGHLVAILNIKRNSESLEDCRDKLDEISTNWRADDEHLEDGRRQKPTVKSGSGGGNGSGAGGGTGAWDASWTLFSMPRRPSLLTAIANVSGYSPHPSSRQQSQPPSMKSHAV